MLYIIPTDTCFWLACSINDTKWFERIYEVKWRDFNKPLAVMVDDYSILENILNTKQIDFLKSYIRPWTVLVDKKIKWLNDKMMEFDKIALRVANNDIEKKLINEVWPIYLTSANLSWKKEIYSINELKHIFWKFKNIKIFAKNDLQEVNPSDIFEFVWDNTEVKYLRKN